MPDKLYDRLSKAKDYATVAWPQSQVVGLPSAIARRNQSLACTKCCVYTTSRSGSATGYTSRTQHVTVNAVSQLRPAYGCWHANGSANETTDYTNPIKVSASIEYPAGTINKVYFSGVRQASIDGGGMLVADPCSVYIPANTPFWVRSWLLPASSSDPVPQNIISTAAFGESFVSGDSTLGNTFTPVDGSPLGGPLFVLGTPNPTTAPVTLALLGDSIMAGSNDTGENNRGFGIMAINGQFPYVTAARSSDLAQYFAAKHLARGNMVAYATHAIVAYGTNDYAAGRSAAQVEADLVTIGNWLLTLGIKPYLCTIIPRTTSTDNWATEVNQTPLAVDPVRVVLNAYIRGTSWDGTSARPYLGYFDTSLMVEGTTSASKWAVGYTDAAGAGVHPTTAGYTRMATAINTTRLAA